MTRVLLALALLALALAAPAQADSDLGAARIGEPLAAPELSAPAGAVVGYQWERCRTYQDLVRAHAPERWWPLADRAGEARELIAAAHGRYLDAPVPVDGAPEGVADDGQRFDGRQAVVAGHSETLTGVRPHTIELWARPRAVDDRYQFLAAQEATVDGERQGVGIWLSSAGLGFERWTDNTKAGVTYAPGLPAGRWTHVAASYDGETMRLFVDGRQVGARATSRPLAAAADLPLAIGARDGRREGFFDGDLDEAAIYSRAVPRAHVALHAQTGASDPCSPIEDAVGSAYTPVGADLGASIRATTTAADALGREIAISRAVTAGPVTDAGGLTVRPRIITPAAGTLADTVQVSAQIDGLPADRVEFLVDGVVRYAKVGEAPYQYTWHTRAEANGKHTVAVRAYGPGASTPATAELTVSVSNRTVHVDPLPFGKESMYAEFNKGSAAVAENLLDDVWPARGFPLPKLASEPAWTEDPYDDAYWRFYHYSLRPQSSLLYMWKTTGDRRYLTKLIANLRSFAAHDAVREPNRLTFDNPHAAAYRTMTLINFYGKLARDGELPDDLERGIHSALERLGAFLEDPRNFEHTHNHGFNEGAALLLLARNFPQMPRAAAWRALAVSRLTEMLRNTVDEDGVEVENSPFYHVYVLGMVYEIAEWAKQHEPGLAEPYTRAQQQMLRYAAYVTQPNGYLPMLGATATTYLPSQDPTVYGPMAAADPEFRFAYTRGKQGTPPPDGTYLFPAAGLFVMRSPLGSPQNLPKQTFVTFDAGVFRTDHSDLDALSITMNSSHGTVLPDSGLFSYTQQPERAYFQGTRAHNTVVVDGKDQPKGAATPGSHGSQYGVTWATGSSRLNAGVDHRRAVVILRQGLTLVVDRLAGSSSHTYEQMWHLAPDATIEARGADVAVSNAAGQRTLRIRQAHPAGLTLATKRGQTSPTLQGWHSSAYGAKTPAWALEFTRKGDDALFSTLLAADEYAAQPSTVSQAHYDGATRVEVCVGGTVGYVVVVPDGPGSVTVAGGGCADGVPSA